MQRCQQVVAKQVTREFDSSRDEYSRLRVLVPEYSCEYEWTLLQARVLASTRGNGTNTSPKLLFKHCIGLHVLLSILNYLSSRLPVLLLLSVDVALLLCRLVVVVDGYRLAVVDGRRSVIVVVIAASSKGVGRCRRRLAGAGIAPSFGIDLAMVDWRRSVVVVASLSLPTLTCCCWWWYVTSARGLAQPAGRSAFAKLAITGRGKLGVIRELLTLHHKLLIINQPYHHDYDLGMRLDDDNGWPAIRRQQTPTGTPSTVGRPRPRRHYGESAMARQVEHDNDNEDNNGPRRQQPTTTTAYNSNGLRRQQPMTMVRDDTDNDNGGSGDTAMMPVCDGDRVHASTSISPKNLASTRAHKYSYQRVQVEYESPFGKFRRVLILRCTEPSPCEFIGGGDPTGVYRGEGEEAESEAFTMATAGPDFRDERAASSKGGETKDDLFPSPEHWFKYNANRSYSKQVSSRNGGGGKVRRAETGDGVIKEMTAPLPETKGRRGRGDRQLRSVLTASKGDGRCDGDGVLRDKDSTRREGAWPVYEGLGSLLKGEYGWWRSMSDVE
ncbi:hypothetical protein EDB89DRAFT_1907168 [Lactarius sanguifluus]|nr:hypothetical protein EDB89DRAFT_1907168 [Lactarius sanguifluus]